MSQVDLHNGDIESLHRLKGTFQNTGGGDASALPVKYLDEDTRVTAGKALMDFLKGKLAYRPTSIVAYITQTSDQVIPEDPGSEPRDISFNFRVNDGGLVEHKENFFVPGVLAPTKDSIQEMGEALAALLSGYGPTFKFVGIAGERR